MPELKSCLKFLIYTGRKTVAIYNAVNDRSSGNVRMVMKVDFFYSRIDFTVNFFV